MARIEGKIDAQMAARAERDKPIAMLAQRVAKSVKKAANVTTTIWLAAISVVLAVLGTFYATQPFTLLGIMQTTLAPSITPGFARFRFFSMLRNETECTV